MSRLGLYAIGVFTIIGIVTSVAALVFAFDLLKRWLAERSEFKINPLFSRDLSVGHDAKNRL